eukprot:746622-Pelagomonas_calceolata.AAC.1
MYAGRGSMLKKTTAGRIGRGSFWVCRKQDRMNNVTAVHSPCLSTPPCTAPWCPEPPYNTEPARFGAAHGQLSS